MPFDSQAFATGQSAAGNGVMDMLGQQMAGLQVQGAQLRNQTAQQTMQMQRVALARQQQYTSDVQSFAQNPTVQGLASLWKYPEFQANTKGIYDAMDPRMRQQEATQLGSFASVLQNAQNKDGTYDPKMLSNAVQIVQQRIDADKAAGRDTTGDEQALQMVQSGDPKQINAVKAMTAGLIAGAVGFDKAGEYLKTIGMSQEPIKTTPGDTYRNPVTGDVVASQPSNLIPTALTNPDGSQRLDVTNPNPGQGGASSASTQTEGGGPASGGATAGGMQSSVAHVLGNEGGFNPKDANGSPTNFGINFKANKAELAKMGITAANFKNMTQAQAAQIYASKYWPQSGAEKLAPNLQAPYFDVYVRSPKIAKMALAKSGGDPQQFMQIANSAFQSMASNPNSGTAPYKSIWAKRDAGNMALVANSAPQAPGGNTGGVSAPVGTPGPGQSVTVDNGSSGGLDTKGAPPNMMFTHDSTGARTGVAPIPNSEADPGSYSPGELYDIAWTHLTTGKWGASGGGMGGGSVPQPVQKAALRIEQQIMRERGISPEQLNGIRSKTAGLTANLNNATQMFGSLTAARENLDADGKLVVSKQQPLVKMGIIGDHGGLGGLISNSFENNTRLDWYETHGSPEQQQAVRAYKDAVSTYAATYGKALSSANAVGGNAPASDSARAQANELNDFGMGPTALAAHLSTNLQEMDNKRGGWQKQAQIARSQLDNVIGPKGGHSSEPVHVTSIEQAQSLPSGTLFVAPNGKTYRKH